jgi:pimeloyl-ACP methyl ester carboxylesterase
MRVRFGPVAALLGVLLTLTGCTSFVSTVGAATRSSSSSPAASSAPPVKPINWTDCTARIQPLIAGQQGSDRPLSWQCGRLDVPVSYGDPGGQTLPLFLVRAVLAGQTNRIGSLVINPGGPGGSGVEAALGLALTLPVDLLHRFDVVGFDPRGVGLSTPVECISPQTKDEIIASEPRPVTSAQLDAAFTLSRKVADGCAKKYSDALGAFSTVATARDMDRIRQGVGDQKLTYLGYSYGTTLGSTYAELFPSHIRALVLDGVVDPDSDPTSRQEATAAALEKSFDAFGANCTGQPAGCPIGANPRQAVQDLLTAAQKSPIPSAKQGETRKATDGVVLLAVLSAMYDTGMWPQLSQALASAQKGDAQGLFTLADDYWQRLQDGTYSNLLDANLAINCADQKDKVSEATVRRLAVEWNQKYPLFGAGSAAAPALGLYDCTAWKASPTPLPKVGAVDTDAPILLVGNTGDPVTPYPGAQDMARDLKDDVLLTWQGQGHTSYPKTPCVTNAVDAYLVDLTPPASGTTCPASG